MMLIKLIENSGCDTKVLPESLLSDLPDNRVYDIVVEIDCLVERIQYDKKLQRVEYCLTAKGQSLLPILYQLQDWGMENIDDVLTIQEMVDVTMG